MSEPPVPFETPKVAIEEILAEIPEIIPFDYSQEITEFENLKTTKERASYKIQSILAIGKRYTDTNEQFHHLTADMLDLLVDLEAIDLPAAHKISDLLVRAHPDSARMWYEKAKLLFQLFTSRLFDNIIEVEELFRKVIDISTNSEEDRNLPYYSYVFLGNINLYQLLTGEEALEQALKFYNQGYRYAKTHELEINEDLIFKNVEIMQSILMNEYPLLVIVYNDAGTLLFDSLFQFIEVMNQDQRFIPNFTALLSAVDGHIKELFRSPVSSAYLVMKNRLLVITTIYDDEEGSWVKTAMIFSYLRQKKFEINKDMNVLGKVADFNGKIQSSDEIYQYLVKFQGRSLSEIDEKISEIIEETFTDQ